MARNHPLASPLLSTGRWDAAMWASRFRSGNFVWRHVLHVGLSTGCRLPAAQAVAAAAGRCFGSTMGSFCMTGITRYGGQSGPYIRHEKTHDAMGIANGFAAASALDQFKSPSFSKYNVFCIRRMRFAHKSASHALRSRLRISRFDLPMHPYPPCLMLNR